MDIPSSTIDFIRQLQLKYSDELMLDEKIVGTPEYWKKAGVVELLRELQYYIDNPRRK